MNVVYEVSLWVEADIASEHALWLRDHVQQMLMQPGFLQAQILDVVDPPAEAGVVARCVQYRVRSQHDLDDYLAGPALHMRAEGVARFGERVRYQRRVLALAAT